MDVGFTGFCAGALMVAAELRAFWLVGVGATWVWVLLLRAFPRLRVLIWELRSAHGGMQIGHLPRNSDSMIGARGR